MTNDLVVIKNETKELKKELDNLSDDFAVSRENILEIIKRGSEAFNDLADLAQQAPLPSTYEALATVMKTVLDANKSLLEIYQTSVRIDQMSNKQMGPQPQIVNQGSGNTNVIMVGSTKELLNFLKNPEVIENDV